MSKPNDASVKPGDMLDGKYRVERVLGSGGMGVVVQARHVDLHQRVAIKLMLPEALAEPESVARFQREARAAVRLHSEHTARVIDVGRLQSGAPYMVMEFLVGKDLGQILEESGAIPQAHAVDFVLQACEAIAEAHALGIVHRDVKPRNLFLTHRIDGRPLVKVLDFGLAKTVDQHNDHALTRTTAVMGSPQYMSPEQMRASREVDHRTDIWSLGICLYEMLTGTVPFEAATVPMLCALVLKEAPRPPSDARPDIPLTLSAIILRCLEKEPAKRFNDVAELAEALEQFGAQSARGSAGRVRHVLSSTRAMAVESDAPPPPPTPPTSDVLSQSITLAQSETRTAATFDSRPHKEVSRGAQIAIGAALVVLCLGALGAILLFLNQRHRAAKDPPIAATSIAHPPPRATDSLPDLGTSTATSAALPAPPPTSVPPAPPPPPAPLASQSPPPPPAVHTVPGGGPRRNNPPGGGAVRPPPPPPPPATPPPPPPPSTTPKKDPGSTF